MNEPGLRRTLPEQFSGSGHTSLGTTARPHNHHHPGRPTDPAPNKRVQFYKSGDPQFNGLQMVINPRTFKTFDALLDSLSKKVPLPFGVRNITTPRGVHTVSSLDDLEDGKSYICSDSRKVKPINLAVARRKPPPWYHARPENTGGERRRAQGREGVERRVFPGYRRKHNTVESGRKRLVVFRNGEPTVNCVVMVQRKTTPTFEAILRYLSELLQFTVTKLHTPEGRRVEGLPGLILCSGTVVAAGREKFKPANYTRTKNNRRSVRRIKALNQKKKSYAVKSRLLSPSSERFIVNQINNTLADSLYSMPTTSIELDSNHILESVAESEVEDFTITSAAAEAQDSLLPADDDIEKSFRVNQDGSMTVEMKVRLTIKEEETIHWTTTVSRLGTSSQLIEEDDFLMAAAALEQEDMDLQPPTAETKDIYGDICKEEPTLIRNGGYYQSSFEEDCIKTKDGENSKTPSLENKHAQSKQASIESITSPTLENTINSDLNQQNGDVIEHYCMLQHTHSRPIPKPRRVASVEANGRCKSAAFQTDSSGEEVTETVMHIYEQQMCQDNFLANICTQQATVVSYSRPATSDTGLNDCSINSNDNLEPEPCRPSTASEPVSNWMSESISLKSNLTSQSHNTDPTFTQPIMQEHSKSQNKKRGVGPRKQHKVAIKRLKSPGNKDKGRKNKQDKPFTSARYINQIYGNKSKANKDTSERKKTKNVVETVTSKESHEAEEGFKTETSPPEPKEMPIQQQTVQSYRKQRRDSVRPLDVLFNPGTNGYVADWLEKSQLKFSQNSEEETESQLKHEQLDLENDPCLMTVAEKVKCLKEKPISSQNSTANPPPQLTRNGSVRQKVKCFESIAEDPITTAGTSNPPSHKPGPVLVQFDESSNSLSTDFPPPPSSEKLRDFSFLHALEASAASSPLYRLSSVSDMHPSSMSPTSDRALSPTDRRATEDKVSSSVQADRPLEQSESPLQRAPSIKRAPLVSNISLERKMSLKKASLDEYTIPKETISPQIHSVTEPAERLTSKAINDIKSSQSYCSSASPNSLTSDHRTSSASMLSNEAAMNKSNKDLASPKPVAKQVKLIGSPSPERKHQTKKTPSKVTTNNSPSLSSRNSQSVDKKASPNVERRKAATTALSPASEKRQIPSSKSKQLKKTSPYSQSLDLTSPPVKHKSPKMSLRRNYSSDDALAAKSKSPRAKISQKKAEQTPLVLQSSSPKQVEVQHNGVDERMDNIEKPEELASFSAKEVTQNTTENQQRIENQSVTIDRSQTENMFDSDCYVELNVSKSKCNESLDSGSDTDRMQLAYSAEDTTTDIDEISVSEDDLLKNPTELNVIVEEPLSEEEQPAVVAQKHTNNFENDSGNDHRSQYEDNSTNNELSLDKELSLDEAEARLDEQNSGKTRQSPDQALLSEYERIEYAAKKLCADIISQSVSEHATFTEKSDSCIAKPLKKEVLSLSFRDEKEEFETKSKSLLTPGTRSAPQSSLSFSYDSSNVITKQPEGNRVKSIREMFLAKSSSENEPKTVKKSVLSQQKLQPETSISAGYQTQTSGELSASEDDCSRKSITKGFVMRTIERLYGKNEPSPVQKEKTERPMSGQKQKQTEQPSIISPFQATRSKTASELSYFNSSTVMDALGVASRCIAFNAQVSPAENGGRVDNEQCFLEENHNLRKSVSDPVAIHHSLANSQEQSCKDSDDKTPYLLLKTDSEDEQKSRKCTYFSLPHVSDSEAVQEELVVVNADKVEVCCESSVAENPEKSQAEKNGKVPGVMDFKLMDNKVHPLVESKAGEEPVVVQPVRGQGVMSRRMQDPDVLDVLYTFCGEHCPIL